MTQQEEAFKSIYGHYPRSDSMLWEGFKDGWQAAIAAVKADGLVAETHPKNLIPSADNKPWCRQVLLYSGNSPHDWLDGNNYRTKLYKLPEGME